MLTAETACYSVHMSKAFRKENAFFWNAAFVLVDSNGQALERQHGAVTSDAPAHRAEQNKMDRYAVKPTRGQ